MKAAILSGIVVLAFPAMALAQTQPPPDMPNDMSAQQMPQSGQLPPPPPPPADPNAGAPAGQVPPTPGMVPADPNAPQSSAAPVGSAANPVVVGGNAMPPPEAKADYPPCSRTVQDSCINPSEAKGKVRRKR
ncbi:Fe-S oxidoreductase [Sphingobium sp. H39-3-25]|uniref:Fe-S oxidoreductase n=1 Tax=Sphingobium arseniciresistens TaxID=3030834 RepID=UPI0023B9D73D|nr:Fe-S oxidoreductase [Sphingobium arseniciresistens]